MCSSAQSQFDYVVIFTIERGVAPLRVILQKGNGNVDRQQIPNKTGQHQRFYHKISFKLFEREGLSLKF